MKILLTTIMLLAGAGIYAANANTSAGAEASATSNDQTFKLIHVNDLSTWMESKAQKTYVFDANNTQVRTSKGVIPGATILASSSTYDVAKTLPQDKASNLVFYCANEACTASHMAAKRATDAGYTNVSVLADGIEGWKKAGKPTAKFKKS